MTGTPATPARRPRQLSLLDCVALGLNCVIGSGVYLLLAPMAKAAGPASLVGIAACALLCVLVALCFAELAGMYTENGGALVYAEAAFGPAVAYVVGWMGLVSTVLGFAAVAAGFGTALGNFVPALGGAGARAAASVALVLALGVINHRGIKTGARTSDVLSLLKVVPLVVLAVAGAAFVRADVAQAAFTAPQGQGYLGAVSSAAFLAVFMISGFEYVPIPAGEARSSERSVPRAVLWSLLGATALYLMLQWVALSVLPDLGAREHPLLDVAERIFGAPGRSAVGFASVVSMAGFCAGTMLVGPLYVEALAERRWLPTWFAARTPQGTPGRAVIVLAGVSAALVVLQDYGTLVDVANIAVFAQYLPVCVAVLVLRVRHPHAPRPFRLPLGPVIPVAATVVSVALLAAAKPRAEEWASSGALLLIGLGAWAATRAFSRRTQP
jgi:basic amino acid/polyamine antiporter, APA family